MDASPNAAASVLAIDTAGASCSAALWREGRLAASRFEPMRRGHAERLVPMIEAVMAEGAMGYADLGRIAVTLGPGGFTGVRIGLATARGLALACGRPLVGVSNFTVLAAAARAGVPPQGSIAVVIDAKRRDIYAQAFAANLRPCTEPLSILPERLADFLPPGPLVLVGDGLPQARPALDRAGRPYALSEAPGLVDAARLAELVASGELGPAAGDSPEPLYLRPPDATPAKASSDHRS